MSLLSTLQTKSRAYITEITDTNALSDANLLIILNDAAREFMRRAEGYPTSTQFNATASTAQYLLSANVPTFASVHKSGLWWQDSSDDWHQLDPETRQSLTARFPAWRNAAAGTPARFFIEGNDIFVHPAPTLTDALAFELNHFARSQDGSANTKYVFTNSTTLELVFLIDFEDALYDFVRSKVAAMLNKSSLATEWMNVFYARCEEAKQKLAYRADLFQRNRSEKAGWAAQRAQGNYQGARY
jgi:hypothetical protein